MSQSIREKVEALNFKEKVERSKDLIASALEQHGRGLVVANSLGKDSMAVLDLCFSIDIEMPCFIITTPFKPKETKAFGSMLVGMYPHIRVYEASHRVPENYYETNPDDCCQILKVEPARKALREMNATCWVTGLRCTEGEVRVDYEEIEVKEDGLVKLNPILLWTEREVWQYLALNHVPVNPLYAEGYRSLGCAPCSRIISSGEPNEWAGRWHGTCKNAGECGIHTQRMGS